MHRRRLDSTSCLAPEGAASGISPTAQDAPRGLGANDSGTHSVKRRTRYRGLHCEPHSIQRTPSCTGMYETRRYERRGQRGTSHVVDAQA